MPNMECRMYEAVYPEVDAAVMVEVKRVNLETGAFVSLLEYNNIEGMILLSDLTGRRITSIHSVVKLGAEFPAVVLRVDGHSGHVDLSRTSVTPQECSDCKARFRKAKVVDSIMRHVAVTLGLDLEPLYARVGWPLYRQYGHAYEAFRLIASDPDGVLDALTYEERETGPYGLEVTKVVPAVTPEVKDALVKDIRRRLSQQPVKICADIKMTCFEFDGLFHIKEAMRKAEAAGNDLSPVKMKLVAAPFYSLTTIAIDKDQGISVLTSAIEACTKEIERHNGELMVNKEPHNSCEQKGRG